jgi:hypothetical protein
MDLPTALGMRALRVVAIILIVLGSLSVAFGLLAIAGSENAKEYSYCAAFAGAGVAVVVLGSLLLRVSKRRRALKKTIRPKDAAEHAVAAASASPAGSMSQKKCPVCGSMVQENWTWCVQCGGVLSLDRAAELNEASDEQSPPSTGELVTEAVAGAVVGAVIDGVIEGVLSKL